MTSQHRLLTEAEAAAFCRYFDRGCGHPVRAFREWAVRWGVPVKRVGRAHLYDQKVLEAFIDGANWTKRHHQNNALKHTRGPRPIAAESESGRSENRLTLLRRPIPRGTLPRSWGVYGTVRRFLNKMARSPATP